MKGTVVRSRLVPTRRRRLPGDRGIVLILFALSITSMLTVGALVLGSSLGYTAVRNAQNAVDAASLAAAASLKDVKQGTAMPGDVLDAATSTAEANGATMGTFECEVVTAAYALTRSEAEVIGACTDTNVASAEAAGIRVTAGDTRVVPFNAFVDQDTITGSARATATVQPVRTVNAPFMVCSSPGATGHPALPVIPSSTDPTGYAVNPQALGKSFVVHGKEMTRAGRDCGNGSDNWRGFVPPDQGVLIPPASATNDVDWLRIDNGNADGTLDAHLSGAYSCSGDVSSFQEGCRISLPLCPKGNAKTGDNFRLYCVKMGAFVITYSKPSGSTGPIPCHPAPLGNSTICATFVGAGTATEGIGSATTFDPNEVVVVKLVE